MQTPVAAFRIAVTRVASRPRPARPAVSARAFALVTLFVSVFIVVGAVREWREVRALRTFRPVSATVLSSDIESVRSTGRSPSTTYRPAVRYEYIVAGERHVADRVTPLHESRSARWATALARRFVPGATVTAFVNPADPDDAFLVRSRSWLPWVFIVGPFLMLLVVSTGLRRRGD